MITEPLSVSQIEALAEKVGGTTKLLSRTSPSYRELRSAVHSEAEWLDHMAAEPRLIKRPIWVIGHDVVVGFSEGHWQELWEQKSR
ncbi:MAG: arsenate reductase [Firmicutes bacterium]|nr:arsenate reductase [Bacillota bacterium]